MEQEQKLRTQMTAACVAFDRQQMDQLLMMAKRYAEVRSLRTALEYAVEEAEVKGLKKGKIEGIAEGLAKGKAEGQRQIAANLKNQGVNIETITLCTGLSVEEINEL